MRKRTLLILILMLNVVFCGLAQATKPAYKHGLTMITPAGQWREALPAGNGTIGALVYGSIHQERMLFNHNELWYGGNIDEIPAGAELQISGRNEQLGRILHQRRALEGE